MKRVLPALLLLAACGGSPEPKSELRPPNFVVVMADDLGYGDLSAYDGWIDVPNIDRLAEEGLKFTDFHSNGAVCSPTRAALMTGRYQQRAGIPEVVFAAEDRGSHIDGMQDVELTLPEMLKSQGYATGITGKWHLGYLPPYNPTRHGFDFYRGYVSGNVDFFSHVDQAGHFDWWHDAATSDEKGYVTTLINKHALDFIEAHADEPFFLYVPHEAPHSPYQAPYDDPKGFRVVGDATIRQNLTPDEIKQRYRDMVVEVDKGVGQIIETLERLELTENTLVWFFSDNGATARGSNGPLRGTKGTVWEGGHRVPGIARRPGTIAPGVTDQLAATMDVFPTLGELAGAPEPVERPLDGVSLVPVFEGGKVERGPMFWSHYDGLAMRDGDWKMVVGESGAEEPKLFNLAEDLGEQTDLSEEHPVRTKEMFEAAQAWLEEVNQSATPQPSKSK